MELLQCNDPSVTKLRFTLDEDFVEQYRTVKPPFGFNGLGELVFLRTYSRLRQDGTNEQWFETVQRVVEGTYSMQLRWIKAQGLYWNDRKAQRSAQEMYRRIFTMKFLPPGRGLWAMGSPLTEEKGLWAALNNCGFTSTENIADELAEPFTFLMDASMLGIGVGFDTKGAGKVTIHAPGFPEPEYLTTAKIAEVEELIRTDPEVAEMMALHMPADWRTAPVATATRAVTFVIPDTREGWVESVRLLLEAYFKPEQCEVCFDYSEIRPEGTPIKGFGGVASGPEPLRDLHNAIRGVLDPLAGQPITITAITDIMNLIGKCVVAGNVRRTAEIVFGDPKSEEYLDLKNYEKNPQRESFGWTSNNSVFAELGMDYTEVAKRIQINGEPGLAWLANMRNYSRMGDPMDEADWRAMGGNPCLEQTLESHELCCLVETFPANHDSLEDFLITLKFAYLYAKTVTLGRTPWARTNQVMLRNRRIGLSQSGIVQAIHKLGIEEYRQWCEEGYQTVQEYDRIYSEWFAIPRSIKTTSVKPSGSVSLLAGATPGMHFPEARTYIRRMRLGKHSDLIQPLLEASYPLEPAFGSEETTYVVEIPVQIKEPVRIASEVSMWEQLSLAAFLQRYWSDNQVSSTVTFDPDIEGHQIAPALELFQYQLKGISFLPRKPLGAYRQMPYEAITEGEYHERVAQLGVLDFGQSHEDAVAEKFCNNDHCEL